LWRLQFSSAYSETLAFKIDAEIIIQKYEADREDFVDLDDLWISN